MDLHFAREHDLLKLPGADQLDRASDRRLVVLGWHRAREQKAPRRRRIEQGQPGAMQLKQPPVHARLELLADVIGGGQRRQREAHAAPPGALAAREHHLRHRQRCGLEPRPVRRAAAVGGESEAADRDRSPAGVLGGVAHGSSRKRAPALGDALKAPAPRRLEADRLAQPAESRVPAVGLLEHEPLLAAPARGAHDRRGIDVPRQRQRHRRERLPRRCAVPRHRELQAPSEPRLIGARERERRA